MKRHDLVYLKSEGRQYAAAAAGSNHPELEQAFIMQIIAGEQLPGIVKRQEDIPGQDIAVGFSTCHYTPEGARIRLNSVVPKRCIDAVVSPFQVFQKVDETGIYAELNKLAKGCGMDVGLFGSSALEVMTGQPYRNQDSDIDLYVKPWSGAGQRLEELAQGIYQLEKSSQVRFDIEVEYQELYGTKLKELLSGQKTVLAKGLYDVQLFERKMVLMEL